MRQLSEHIGQNLEGGTFEIDGRITSADARNLAERLSAAFSGGGGRRLLGIVRHYDGFEPSLLIKRLPRVLGEPDLRRMGLQVAKGLAERGVVHLLRDVLVTPAVRQAAGVSGV